MPRISNSDSFDTIENAQPDLGPSDSQSTGERESVNPSERDDAGADIAPDRVTTANEAGLSSNVPDPARNGG